MTESKGTGKNKNKNKKPMLEQTTHTKCTQVSLASSHRCRKSSNALARRPTVQRKPRISAIRRRGARPLVRLQSFLQDATRNVCLLHSFQLWFSNIPNTLTFTLPRDAQRVLDQTIASSFCLSLFNDHLLTYPTVHHYDSSVRLITILHLLTYPTMHPH